LAPITHRGTEARANRGTRIEELLNVSITPLEENHETQETV